MSTALLPILRRSRAGALALGGALASLTALSVPATAGADIQGVYRPLAERRLSPAPLVPTTVPRALSPLDKWIDSRPGGTRSSYAIIIRGATRGGYVPDAVVELVGGRYKSLDSAVDSLRAHGDRIRTTRVRGRRGYRFDFGRERGLLWAEGGRVYRIVSTTPRTISFSDMHSIAAGLDRLEGAFTGSDATGENEAFVVTTRRTITADVAFTGQCTAPDGSSRNLLAGNARVTVLPRTSSTFAFDLADDPWQGTASGTIDASGGTLQLRATSTFYGESCDTGPVSLALRPDS